MTWYENQNQQEYMENIRRKQVDHRRKMNEYYERRTQSDQQPCLHNNCDDCRGTGRKFDGTICVHMISCPCPKCTPHFMCCSR